MLQEDLLRITGARMELTSIIIGQSMGSGSWHFSGSLGFDRQS